DKPEQDPREAERLPERAVVYQRQQDDDQQQELEHREEPLAALQYATRVLRPRAEARQQQEQRRRSGEPGGEEKPAERPRVAPYRLVRDCEQNARVTGDEQVQRGADDGPDTTCRAVEQTREAARGREAEAPVAHEGVDKC